MEKQSNLAPEIRDIWTDAFRFHATFERMSNSAEDWTRCAKTLETLVIKHNGHPFAQRIFGAVYDYLSECRKGMPVQIEGDDVSG